MRSVLIVGAGITGSAIARELAEKGVHCQVIDSRDHIGGNCYTERDPATGIMVHRYGPHIFHTANMEVWEWIQRFGEFKPYDHRVYARARGEIFNLPINLQTLNQFFKKTMNPAEAEAFVRSLAVKFPASEELNFEEQALSVVGTDLYEAFFKGYTEKQWGVAATEIPGSILKRIPLRFNYDATYYNHPIQAMPVDGYTAIFEKILDHPNIDVELDTEFRHADAADYDHVFYSGQIDRYFGFSEGHLPYRTLDFEEIRSDGDFQGCAVMNFCGAEIPWTRVTEHKHFSPWEMHESSVCHRESSRSCEDADIPYYPVHLMSQSLILERYRTLAASEKRVSFVGRLGSFQYVDMDTAVAGALREAYDFVQDYLK